MWPTKLWHVKTFSFRPFIPDSEYLKIKEENKDFSEEEYFIFEAVNLGEKKNILKGFFVKLAYLKQN